jgi:hypothetical protein
MTARLSLTQAQIARAIRAAKAEGLVPVITPIGMAFVESDKVRLPSQDQAEPAPFDSWKAKREARREGRS